MKKLIAAHEAKLAELDNKLARIEWLEQQIMEMEGFGREDDHLSTVWG